jgi:hypothetical protein
MPEPYHSIEEKAEDAVSAWIQDCIAAGSLTGVDIAVGGETADLAYPKLSIMATSSEPDEDNNGNSDVTITVSIETKLNESTRAVHSALSAAVNDVLVGRVWDNVAAEINALSPTDFTAIHWQPGTLTRFAGSEDESRMTQRTALLICAPSTIV